MKTVSESFKTYSRDAKVPVLKDGRPNPQAYRQISAGSILGMWGLCLGYERGEVRGLERETRMDETKYRMGILLMRWWQ